MTLTLAKLAFAGRPARRRARAPPSVGARPATATTVLALELGGTARDPWQRTFAAAHGAHVLVTAGSAAELRRIAGLRGVAERDAPLPRAIATVASRTDQLEVVGVGSPARIDRPIGAPAPRAGEIVLERSFAEALGLRAGAPITLAGGVRLRVAGTAVTASQPRFPRRNPGLVWATRATLERIAPDRSRWRWRVALRLRDPAAAPTFAARATAQAAPGTLFIETSRDQRASAMRDAGASGVILTAYTLVLLVVVFAVVAILVEARVAAQQREIGLLKAVGITPRQVTAVFAIEAATLGLVAALMGFAAGVVLAPSLATTSSGALLGSPTVAPSLWHLVAGAGPVVAVLVASAWSAMPCSARARRRPATRCSRCPFRSRSASRTSSPAAAARAGSRARSP